MRKRPFTAKVKDAYLNEAFMSLLAEAVHAERTLGLESNIKHRERRV
jgi:hypothetical protein